MNKQEEMPPKISSTLVILMKQRTNLMDFKLELLRRNLPNVQFQQRKSTHGMRSKNIPPKRVAGSL